MAEDTERKNDPSGIFSEDFDANKAIFNPNFAIPNPDVAAVNNVDSFVAKYEGKHT